MLDIAYITCWTLLFLLLDFGQNVVCTNFKIISGFAVLQIYTQRLKNVIYIKYYHTTHTFNKYSA